MSSLAFISATHTKEVDKLNSEAYVVRNKDPKNSLAKAEQALELATSTHYKKGEAQALNNIGFYYTQVSEHEKGLELLIKALDIFSGLNDEIGISDTNYNLGVLQLRFANFAMAIEAFNKAIAVREKHGDKAGLAICYFQLAYINEVFGNSEAGMEFCKKSLDIRQELNDVTGSAAVLTLMGAYYTRMKDYDNARKTFLQAMELRKKEHEYRGYFATQFRWIEFLIQHNEIDEAEASALKGLEMSRQEKEWFGVLRFLQANARIQLLKEENVKGLNFLGEAIKLAEERKFKSIAYDLYEMYSNLLSKQGKYEEALEYYQKFHKLKEEVLSAQSGSQLRSIQLMNQIESSKREAELERIKNVDLKNAFKIIEEKNNDITDSIHYAQRIQQAILPSLEEFRKALPQSFVIFRPRDIVSGDFYWLSEIDNKILFAAADCTGHGVPGAFMSMIGTTLLNEIVNEKKILKPSDILFHLREAIVRSLKQTGASGENKDGMDIALCCLDTSKGVLEYAGAHNPLWLVSATGEFREYAADKQPIGIYLEERKRFCDHTIQLKKGDTIYIFTDGYADQFGGPKGKKFKYKQLHENIVALNGKDLEAQKKTLETTFVDWKGELEQLDDVLLVGVRY